MEEVVFALITAGVPAALFGGGWLWKRFGSARGRALRRLRRASLFPCSEVKEGELCKLVGRLHLEGPALTAPLTGRPCAYYHLMVYGQKGSGGGHWRKLLEERDNVEQVRVVDESGEALVELFPAQVVVDLDFKERSGLFKEPGPRLREFMHSRGELVEGWVFNKPLRYHEGVLEEGERVALVGRVKLEPAPDPRQADGIGYRGQALRPRVVAPGPGVPLLISDDASVM